MSNKVSLPQLAKEFLASLVGRAPATKKLYQRVIVHLFEFIGNNIGALELANLQVFLQHLEEEHSCTKNTLRVNVNIIRSFLRFLKLEDLRSQIKTIKPQKTLPLVPKPEEVQAMIDCTKGLRNKIMVQIPARTGIRVSELCHLHIEDIDLPNLRIIVRSRDEWSPKGGKERIVRIDSQTATLVKKYIGPRKEGRLIDVSPSTVRDVVRKAAIKAKVRNANKITPHKLRHFFACDALQRGIDIRSLQKLLGHSALSVTEIYLDFGFDRVSESFDRAFGGKNNSS